MRSLLAALLALAALPAAAAEPPVPERLPQAAERLREDLARVAEAMSENMGRVMLSLQELVRQLPRYEAPEFNENGDIIIRRKPDESAEKRRPDGTI